MFIATWNVNSIRARLDVVKSWLSSKQYDLVLLQETKCTDQDFEEVKPELESLGYNIVYFGQKSYNGVCILSKKPIDSVKRGLDNEPDTSQARYLEIELGNLRVVNIYLPNGNPIDSPKFTYKLDWMDAMIKHTKILLEECHDSPLIICGDFNVIPEDMDCYNPKAFKNDAVAHPESRKRFDQLLGLGFIDSLRTLSPDEIIYTYWGYRGGCWPKNNGLRLDHILLSPYASNMLKNAGVDKDVRAMERASDHALVWVELNKDQ